MEEFTELQHAFIAAQYYKYLTKSFGDSGLQLFIFATNKYAEQRGSRMAQRAIRDGKPLDFGTYREYGEWESTDTAQRIMGGFHQDVISYSPDYEIHIRQCPWAFQFKVMNMQECGVVYCSHLDRAIARGFNPCLKFDVPQSVNDSDCCIQIMRSANFNESQTFTKASENIKNFDYHCAHIFKTFGDLAKAVFKEEGAQISQYVMQEFAAQYGEDAAAVLRSFETTDFNTI